MVRFQPVSSSSDSESDDSFDARRRQSQSQSQSQSRSQPRRVESPSDDSEEDEQEEIQLPLRGRTPQVPLKTRSRLAREEEEEEEDEDQSLDEERKRPSRTDEGDEFDRESKYSSHDGRARTRARADVDTRKLELMDAVLMDEEEETFLRTATAEDQDESLDDASVTSESQQQQQQQQPTARFAMPSRSAPSTAAASSLPARTPLRTFFSSVAPYQRSSTRQQHHPRNPLAMPSTSTSSTSSTSVSSEPKSQRSVLDFMQHSFRVGWSPFGRSFFYPTGIDGCTVTEQEFELLAVDTAAHSTPTVGGSILGKRALVQTALETHLEFHSRQSAPSSAKQFGQANGTTTTTAAAANSVGAFTFGTAASQSSSSSSSASSLTPFTQLVDAHIASFRSLRDAPFGPRVDVREVDLALSTLMLLRALYSSEEAERLAPKLSRSQELIERATRSTGEDVSVITAREDSYAIMVGREAAFETKWLQTTITEDYVTPRIRELQQQEQEESDERARGSDGVTGTKMLQVLTHLIGHDLLAAVETCISAGNFRLATLLAQLNSYASTGRLQSDGTPTLESSQKDIGRQLSLWLSKERGMGTYIPKDIETIYRLMSGDVLIQPSLDWIQSLGLHYWYIQPKGEHTNIHRALINYKKNAFMTAQSQVRKPFPSYPSYVPVERRRGAQPSRTSLTADDDDDAAMDGDVASVQTCLVSSTGVASTRSASEYYDLRYGLLDLYTEQSRDLSRVLSPQTHVPHVLDHNLAWHLFAVLQSTPLNQFGPHLAHLHMNYIHQIELLSSHGGDDFWKWSIYVALAATFPSSSSFSSVASSFDREHVIKSILMRHVTWDRQHPFALPLESSSSTGALKNRRLPSSLPRMHIDDTNVFSLALVHTPTPEATQWNTPIRSTPIEEFLIQRCHIPSAWLCECKAIGAVYEREWSVACFYYLHAGEIGSAYDLFRTHLLPLWLLSVLNAIESGVTTSLESSLFDLLQFFSHHATTLFGWATGGGGLVLTFLDFRRHFEQNLRMFTYSEIVSTSNSLKERSERFNSFRAYQANLQQFLQRLDEFGQTHSASADEQVDSMREFEKLAWSKMSGTILQHLHALQPIESELASTASGIEEKGDTTAAIAPSIDLRVGELVSAADRLAVLTDFKDSWLQQFA